MFERKLEALEFHSPLDFDYQGTIIIVFQYYFITLNLRQIICVLKTTSSLEIL